MRGTTYDARLPPHCPYSKLNVSKVLASLYFGLSKLLTIRIIKHSPVSIVRDNAPIKHCAVIAIGLLAWLIISGRAMAY